MTKTDRKPVTASSRDAFCKEQLEVIKKLQDDVLRSRERLRNKTGALRDAQNDLYNGLAEGFQLKLLFGDKANEQDDPEELSATG